MGTDKIQLFLFTAKASFMPEPLKYPVILRVSLIRSLL